jgi:hypothetical protein
LLFWYLPSKARFGTYKRVVFEFSPTEIVTGLRFWYLPKDEQFGKYQTTSFSTYQAAGLA